MLALIYCLSGAADTQQASLTADSKPDVPRQQASSKIGPAALHLLNVHKLKKSDITPTGPQGIITKGDVLAFVESGGQSSAAQSAADEPRQQPKPDAQQSQQQAVSQSQAPADQKAQSDKQLESSKSKPAKEAQQPAAGQAGRKGRGVRYTDNPNSQMRKIIAQRLLESKQTIPSLYVTATADIDAVATLRQQLKDQGKKVSCCHASSP